MHLLPDRAIPSLRRAVGTIALLAALAGCEGVGFSGRDAELARQRAGDFYVSTASREGAILVARGQNVAVEPAPGFCLAEDSIETSDRAAFVLIGDCAIDAPDSGERGERGEMTLPRAVPGIMTVSISGDEGIGGGSLERLRSFLATAGGKAMLGRAGTATPVQIRESREVDGVLFVHLEDSGNAPIPVFQSHFWRAFIDLNGRMTVATISGFREKPMESEEMLAYLVSQVQTLQAANVGIPRKPTTMIARAAPSADAKPAETTEPAIPDVEALVAAPPSAESTSEAKTPGMEIAVLEPPEEDVAPSATETDASDAALSGGGSGGVLPPRRPQGVTLAPPAEDASATPSGAEVAAQAPAVPPEAAALFAPRRAPPAPLRPRR